MAKLNHLPFEDWLFSDTALTPEENRALQEHLQSCSSCRQLSAAWLAVESQLQTAPSAEPAPGFTSRWATRLEEDRKAQQRRQVLVMLIFSIGGAMMLLASVGLLALPILQSPKPLLWMWLYQIFNLFVTANGILETFSLAAKAITEIIPLPVWVLLMGVFSQLAVLWVVTLRVINNRRRMTNESYFEN